MEKRGRLRLASNKCIKVYISYCKPFPLPHQSIDTVKTTPRHMENGITAKIAQPLEEKQSKSWHSLASKYVLKYQLDICRHVHELGWVCALILFK